MHVVMFGDQHAESLGGAQVSMRLQRRFLEKAGHTVTIVAPAMHGPRARAAAGDSAYVDLPSIPITVDREYSMTWPGRSTDRWLDAAMAGRPPVDVVHIQADFWGAFIGVRYAQRHGIPIVHTMHNRLDVGIEATTPFPKTVLRVLNAWQRRALGRRVGAPEPGHDGWAYLRRFGACAAAITAPSAHFAHRLEANGVLPASGAPAVDVIWNGIDDDVLDDVLATTPTERAPGPARFVWLGRMSPEKRLMPFLEALAASGVEAEVEIIGGGGQLRAARRLVEKLRPPATVTFAGRMPYAQTLRRIAAADAVVQTSIGFETQGMTIFEAASLGTPSVVSDPDLAAELGGGSWAVGDGTTADPSVAALADALREAASEISAGTPRVPDPTIRERFRQSSRTAAMVDVYVRATA
ncbi:glycosyltransferase family 4 protein [Microbacterium trichothecenolyticum]|uniref:D-inositol 3-phosphate glycosyltransferase n=1 Tax=Microbacterium trichothecenolyticum TaxID=69370 RepID=A0A0M2H749_MICTR|nr:glycosyltransferase family 4 protein [Microbacterium trichothecenolyticum]KJL42210.1 UDP-D-galactose:(glucosyl)lipopolysaccharide-1,6-D-galactosyltransferase [Microbacterium trichothecenolyticum]